MITKILPAGSPEAFIHSLELLRSGEVIAIPTDTVYGVASDGLNPEAIDRLFAVKQRPRDKPIPLLLADVADISQVAASGTAAAEMLAEKFWPGGLTLVVRAREQVPKILRAEGDSVAIRVPDHRIPRELARALGRPLAATSANISGGPNPSSALEVQKQLGGRIELILDGGAVGQGLPSTVLDLTATPPRLVRAGSLPIGEIEAALGCRIISDVDRD